MNTDKGRILCTLQGCAVLQYHDKRVVFTADADIDADGSPRAYDPIGDKGLDALANAGHKGNWWSLVTDTGYPDGDPVIQSSSDPAPGFYISTTSYQWSQFGRLDPLRYVDAGTVPFIVVEGYIRRRAKGVVLGCRARVTNEKNGMFVDAVVADLGPLTKIGELSIAAAKAIGVDSDARTGGESEHVITYELWPDTPAVIGGRTYDLIPSV